MVKKLLITICLFALAFCINAQSYIGAGKTIDPYHYPTTKQKKFNKAAVACAHPLAAMVGAQIMKSGGNAIDAAIAVQLALAVVYPGAGNIGGGGFMVARVNGKSFTLDFREVAPSKASRDMYVDEQGNANTTLSQNGHLSCGVPGTVKGLFESMPYAKLPFATLIQPAITLASKGFVLTEAESIKLNKAQEEFIKYNTKIPAFVKTGGWQSGDTLIQKDLANTLIRIKNLGAKGFYEGKTAQLIESEMERGKGLLTLSDLKSYKTIKRKPLQFNYKSYDIVTMQPPSSGGILLCQMMKMVRKYPLTVYGFESVKSVHLMVESCC